MENFCWLERVGVGKVLHGIAVDENSHRRSAQKATEFSVLHIFTLSWCVLSACFSRPLLLVQTNQVAVARARVHWLQLFVMYPLQVIPARHKISFAVVQVFSGSQTGMPHLAFLA